MDNKKYNFIKTSDKDTAEELKKHYRVISEKGGVYVFQNDGSNVFSSLSDFEYTNTLTF